MVARKENGIGHGRGRKGKEIKKKIGGGLGGVVA
jgi:hypothetical protein